MEIIISFFIFCLVLFLYLHIQYHLKTSSDLEIFVIDEPLSKDKFEEACDLRQPILFRNHGQSYNLLSFGALKKQFGSFDIKVRNTLEVTQDLYASLPLRAAQKLFEADKKSGFFSENNCDFIAETNLIKVMKSRDDYLRPYMVCNCIYDFIVGASGVETPLKYELNYRNYFVLTEGSAVIKIAPPSASQYIDIEKDYENFEFRTKDKVNNEKIKYLEMTLEPGRIFYLPAYWWYSIKLGPGAFISTFKYRTYMNNLAILPSLTLYALQNQNIRRGVNHKYKKENENATLQDQPTLVKLEDSQTLEDPQTLQAQPTSEKLEDPQTLEESHKEGQKE